MQLEDTGHGHLCLQNWPAPWFVMRESVSILPTTVCHRHSALLHVLIKHSVIIYIHWCDDLLQQLETSRTLFSTIKTLTTNLLFPSEVASFTFNCLYEDIGPAAVSESLIWFRGTSSMVEVSGKQRRKVLLSYLGLHSSQASAVFPSWTSIENSTVFYSLSSSIHHDALVLTTKTVFEFSILWHFDIEISL